MKIQWVVRIGMLFSVVLTGCSQPNPPLSNAVPSPRLSPSPALTASFTPAPSSTPTASATPIPTQTFTPTSVPPTFTPTPPPAISIENAARLKYISETGSGTAFDASWLLDNQSYVVATKRGYYVYQVGDEQPKSFVEIPGATVSALSPDGKLIAFGFKDGTVQALGLDGTFYYRLTAHKHQISAIAFSPDGKYLATGDLGRYDRNVFNNDFAAINVWNAADGSLKLAANLQIWALAFLSFSSDSQSLYMIGTEKGNTPYLANWDILKGIRVGRYYTSAFFEVNKAAFSPDSNWMALAGQGRGPSNLVSLYDRRVFEVKKEYYLGGSQKYWYKRITSIAFSPDSKYLAYAGETNSIEVRDIATGKTLVSLPFVDKSIEVLRFSPDASRLLSVSDQGVVRVWDLSSKQNIITNYRHVSIRGGMFFPNMALFAYVNQMGAVSTWNPFDGHIEALSEPVGNLSTLTFTTGKDRIYLALNRLVGVRFLEVNPEKINVLWDNPDLRAWISAVSPDGSALVLDKIVQIQVGNPSDPDFWDQDSGRIDMIDRATNQVIHTLIGRQTYSEAIQFSPDGKNLAVLGLYKGPDTYLELWDLGSDKSLGFYSMMGVIGQQLAYSNQGDLIAASNTDTTYVLKNNGKIKYDLSKINPDKSRRGYLDNTALVFSPDGTILATGDFRGVIQLWDIVQGVNILTFTGHSDAVNCLSFSPDGRYLVSGSKDGTLRVWGIP